MLNNSSSIDQSGKRINPQAVSSPSLVQEAAGSKVLSLMKLSQFSFLFFLPKKNLKFLAAILGNILSARSFRCLNAPFKSFFNSPHIASSFDDREALARPTNNNRKRNGSSRVDFVFAQVPQKLFFGSLKN